MLAHPTGTETFYIRYTFNGKQKKKILGAYPDVSLAEARVKYGEVIKQISEGIDPLTPPTAPQVLIEVLEEDVSVDWVPDKYLECYDKHHAASWSPIVASTLKLHILPKIGNRPILSIRKRDAYQDAPNHKLETLVHYKKLKTEGRTIVPWPMRR